MDHQSNQDLNISRVIINAVGECAPSRLLKRLPHPSLPRGLLQLNLGNVLSGDNDEPDQSTCHVQLQVGGFRIRVGIFLIRCGCGLSNGGRVWVAVLVCC